MACSDKTHENGFKLKNGRFRLEIWKKFFTVKVVKQWYRLARKAMAVQSLQELKSRLDGTLGNMI